MPFRTSEERNRYLPRYLGFYNGAGATWLSVASAPSTAPNGCFSLNDLVSEKAQLGNTWSLASTAAWRQGRVGCWQVTNHDALLRLMASVVAAWSGAA